MDKHGVGCWGSVTLMTAAATSCTRTSYVRRGSIDYVKDTISQISEWGGEIITIVPSTVGKVVPMGSPRTSGSTSSRSRNARRTLRRRARIGLEPLNRFETYFINRPTRRLRSPRTWAATAASASTSST